MSATTSSSKVFAAGGGASDFALSANAGATRNKGTRSSVLSVRQAPREVRPGHARPGTVFLSPLYLKRQRLVSTRGLVANVFWSCRKEARHVAAAGIDCAASSSHPWSQPLHACRREPARAQSSLEMDRVWAASAGHH